MSPRLLPDWIRNQYPFDSQYLKHPNGASQHYIDEGEGKPVLMLHGNPTWSFFYREVIKRLRGRHRCVVPDHLGCGLSDKPQDWGYRLQGHIDNVARLVDHLKLDRFDLIVHDWGGAIGMGLATSIPERIRRIVILNTAAFRSSRIPFRISMCRAPLIGEWLVRRLNGFAWPATFMTTHHPMENRVKRAYLWPYRNWNDRIAIARFVQDIPLKPSDPSYPTLCSIEEKLSLLGEKPVSIHWGGLDWCFDRGYFEEWKRRFPAAENTLYPKTGHYLLEDSGSAIIPEIQKFLA